VQTNVATLAEAGDASLAVLRFSWLIFMLPHSVVTVSLATAYFTRMSAHARDGDRLALRADISASLRTILMIMTLAVVSLLVVSGPFARLFGGDDDAVEGMARVLAAYVLGLIPFSVLFVVQRVFYALGDTRTPFFMQCLQAGTFVAGATVVATVPSAWIAVGIALVTSLAGSLQTLVGVLLLRHKLGGIDGRLILRRAALFALAAVPASLVGLLLAVVMGTFDGGAARSSELAALLTMLTIVAAMTATYGAVLAILRVPEFRDLSAPLARRLRRNNRA